MGGNRLPGFGVTTNIINGGLECNRPGNAAVEDRVKYYERYAEILGVSPGPNLYCGGIRRRHPRRQEGAHLLRPGEEGVQEEEVVQVQPRGPDLRGRVLGPRGRGIDGRDRRQGGP